MTWHTLRIIGGTMNQNNPNPAEKAHPVPFTVFLDTDTKQKLAFLAKRTYRNQSQVIRWLINTTYVQYGHSTPEQDGNLSFQALEELRPLRKKN